LFFLCVFLCFLLDPPFVPDGVSVSDGVTDEVSDGDTDEVSDGDTDEVSDGDTDEVSDGVTDEVSDGGKELSVPSVPPPFLRGVFFTYPNLPFLAKYPYFSNRFSFLDELCFFKETIR